MRIIFYAPKFAPRVLLLKLSNLNSVEAEIDIKKLLFLGRLITQANMAETVKSLFLVRVENYFDSRFSSLGAIPSICETLRDLFQLFLKTGSLILFFLPIPPGKNLLKRKSMKMKREYGHNIVLTTQASSYPRSAWIM